jgi:hypothetical protein
MTRLLAVLPLLSGLLLIGLDGSAREPKQPANPKPQEKKTKPADEKPAVVVPDKPPTAEQLAFFEKKIRPVFVQQCYGCHAATAEKIKGGLVLDTRDGIRKGGETGPAIMPGDVKKSLLIKAIHYQDDELKMPPKQKLSDEVIADIEKWIAMGAPDPRDGPMKTGKKEIDIESGRKFWSFQPPKKVTPNVKGTWARTDIDRFILAGLQEKGLKPVADADRATLVRRLYFDLIGLPPSPEEQAEAEKLTTEQLVDKLLASPHFGERWGRHWLDVARYAESSGKTVNMNFPHAWRYRDYVIAAFNSDKPYDQFIKEQLAGDLMPTDDPKKKAERAVATGFLAIGSKSLNERNGLQFELDVADEQIDVTTQALLGLTAACARCHDHKFDPIPQKDYYALSGIFRSTETCYGTIRLIQSNRPSPTITLPKDCELPPGLPDKLTADEKSRIQKQIDDLNKQIAEAKDPIRTLFQRNQISLLRSRLDSYDSEGDPKLLAMGVRDKSSRGGPGGVGPRPGQGGFGPRGGFGGTTSIGDSPLYERGETDKPTTSRIPRGMVQVLTPTPLKIATGQSGRLDLANAIASKDNPLTARVMANRVWLHLFGTGIVPTPDNFGAAGQMPTNQELLDYLAVRFVDNGWSVKKLIREIVLSRAYQLSSAYDAKNYGVDPDNALVWRMSKRRLEAEPLHDAMLAIAGRLDTKAPVGSSVSRAGEGNAGGRGRFGPGLQPNDRHRTVYLAIVRESLPEELALFDFPDPSVVTGERSTTTIPAQSLYLMNNGFVIRQSEATAERVLAAPGTDDEKIHFAYKLCFARKPTEKETKAAIDFLKRYIDASTGTGTAGAERAKRAAWSALCQALIASAEFSNLN